MIVSDRKPILKDEALYFTDNGAVYCGRHCGMTARFTGRDISGQKVARVSARDLHESLATGLILTCETCK